jgi:hypothetical protein
MSKGAIILWILQTLESEKKEAQKMKKEKHCFVWVWRASSYPWRKKTFFSFFFFVAFEWKLTMTIAMNRKVEEAIMEQFLFFLRDENSQFKSTYISTVAEKGNVVFFFLSLSGI